MLSKNTFYKFTPEGKVVPYYGNTVISFVQDPTSEIYRIVSAARKALMESGFSDCLAFLPESSFHMTVKQLCRYIDRGTDLWPKDIDENLTYRQIDPILKEKVERIPFPEDIYMVPVKCMEATLRLRPYDERSERLIRKYRDDLAEVTTIRYPGHDTYGFHISYAYHVKEYTPAQQEERDALCDKLTRELLTDAKPFRVMPPKFVIFNDMMSYETDLSRRGDKW